MKKFIVYFTIFILLILGGVCIKRVFGHPEFVVLFHIPGAVCLVLAGMALKEVRAETYAEEVAIVRQQLGQED
ncbi:MAG: hypothetical protein LR011_01625 [Verrucomicrobia bacterium]|nr:hypothetical protein [Verrucomicrobiota bacterium]